MFAFEVFTRKRNKTHLAALSTAIFTSYLLTKYFFYVKVFSFNVTIWNNEALPYFILLGILAGFNSVFLTKSVLFCKKFFGSFQNDYVKIISGSLIISTLVFFFPSLYGEGYAGIKNLTSVKQPSDLYILLPFALALFLKPIATSVTLGAGGDGGVFAPSLFIGAFLGLITALTLNYFFHLNLIALNFIIIGMAAVLSGSIHAPLTSIFLVCAIADNYILFVPIVIASLISWLVAHFIFPYTVYTYKATA